MNMNRIINMVINQFIRTGIRSVMKGGMGMFTKSRKGNKAQAERQFETGEKENNQQVNVKVDKSKVRTTRR